MADVSDVEAVFVSTLTQVIYPNGTGSPSITGNTIRLPFRGWPIPANLDADLKAGIANISIFPQDNEQKTTRYARKWQSLPVSTPELTLTASNTVITVGGTPSSPLNVAAIVNSTGFIYPVQASDTLNSIATGLAALINAVTPASSSGPVITIPAAHRLVARVGIIANIVQEIKRQKRGFQITFWCPDGGTRDTLAATCDLALANIDYLSLPDGTAGRLVYERTRVSDQMELNGIYRRDLFYSVEYGTTVTQSAAQIVTELFNVTGGPDPNAPALESFSI